jgi:hypothetical protein
MKETPYPDGVIVISSSALRVHNHNNTEGQRQECGVASIAVCSVVVIQYACASISPQLLLHIATGTSSTTAAVTHTSVLVQAFLLTLLDTAYLLQLSRQN